MDSNWILGVGLSIAFLALTLVYKVFPDEKSRVLHEFTIKNKAPWILLLWLASIIYLFFKDSSTIEYRILMAFNFLLISFNIWRSRHVKFRFLEDGIQDIDGRVIKAENITTIELIDKKLMIHSTKFINDASLESRHLKDQSADGLIVAIEEFVARYDHIAFNRISN